MIKNIQDEILRLKKEKDICILAHSYVGMKFWKSQILQATAMRCP